MENQAVSGSSAERAQWARTVEQLFASDYGRLCGLARRYLSSRAGAEDVVQEAFAKFSALTVAPTVGKEGAYLRSIVVNEARSVLRRRQVHDRHLHRWIGVEARSVDGECVARCEAALVRSAVGKLSERQRQVVLLRYASHFSEREIAEELAISKGSVKTHASRALETMRSNLVGAV